MGRLRYIAIPTLLGLALGSTGCIKRMLINGQIEGTRQASVAFDTMGDWDLAYKAASASIVQFEGMHVLAPDNEDALFLLMKGWIGYAYAFVEDDVEEAQDSGDRAAAEYHRRRAVNAYDSGVKYGLELIRKKGDFAAARKDEATLKAWLAKHFTDKDDAPVLFWTGYGWAGRTNLKKDDAEAVAELWVAVALVERSVELDPTVEGYSGTIALGAYHARTANAELEQSKQLFERAIEKTKGQSLLVLFNYASSFACSKADVALYGKLLGQVLESEENEPAYRLSNIVSKRRARRWKSEKRMFDSCSMEPAAPAPPS